MIPTQEIVLCVALALLLVAPGQSLRPIHDQFSAMKEHPARKSDGCRTPNARFLQGERVLTGRSHERISKHSLPKDYFWGNVDGVNYLTPVHNQHIPQYCGSCWAFATSSMISDRIKIRRAAAFPEVVLSAQVLVNCHGGGSCHGGNPLSALEYMATTGVPEEGCQNYEAVDGECAPLGTCEDCAPGLPPGDSLPGTCTAISNFTAWRVSEYGYVSGGDWKDALGVTVSVADKIKAELWMGGPVSCGIMATDALEAYTGGVYSEVTWTTQPNHELMIVGWGQEENGGQEYWIGRNSWGTYWGERGLFRIKMHSDNLGIEDGCSFARPVVPHAWLPPRHPALPYEAAVASATLAKAAATASATAAADAAAAARAAAVEARVHLAVAPVEATTATAAVADSIPMALLSAAHRTAAASSASAVTSAGAFSLAATFTSAVAAGWGALAGTATSAAAAASAAMQAGPTATARAIAATDAAEALAAAAPAPEWLQQRGSYLVDTRVQAGRYHSYANPCTQRGSGTPASHVTSPLPHTLPAAAQLPTSYDVRNVVNIASADRNQHQPRYCGSCWAQSTAAALSDRIAMARQGRWPEIDLSTQVLVNCVTANETKGCHGGDPTAAYSWVLEHGLVDDTCASYEARDSTCDAVTTCRTCNWEGCWAIPETQYPSYRITEHGQVVGEAQIMAEIVARGPVACSLCATAELEAYRGGVFVDTTGCTAMTHSIVIAGFGEEANGQKYWIGRNSWGREWGERGWFRLSRGSADLGVTTMCDWAVPAALDF